MKNYMKSIIAMVALMLCSASVWAQGTFDITITLDGGTPPATPGTVVPQGISDGVATLTVTANDGYYIEASDITVTKTIKGQFAQARLRGQGNNISAPISVMPLGAANPTGTTTYTFPIEDENYDYEVNADFHRSVDISNAAVNLSQTSFTYDGDEKKPSVTSVELGRTTIASSYYSVSYENNVAVADATSATPPTVIVTATTLPYTGVAKATFTINPAPTMDVNAEGYSGTYDGNAHGITVSAPKVAIVKYGESEGSCTLDASPTYTDAGDYTVYYKVSMENYTPVTGSAKVTISQAAGSISFATAEVEKTYGEAAFTNALMKTGDGTVSYASGNTGVATVDSETGSVTIVGAGDATITATVADSKNYTYATKSASYKLTVKTAKMDVSAEGYSGTYDGNVHGITVSAPKAAIVKYGESEGSCTLDASPTYTDAGDYTVYYKVTMENYTPVTGSAKVTISKASLQGLSVSISSWMFTTEPSTPSVTGNLSQGDVTYEYKVKDAEDNTYSTTVPTAVGSYAVRATVAETKNYLSATATADFEITPVDVTNAVITLSQTSYTYDGTEKEPEVTVTVNNIVIPAAYYAVTYTNNVNAGMATVTLTFKDGITGSSSTTFKIEKATPALSVSISNWVYGTTPSQPIVTGAPINTAVSITYKEGGAEDNTYSSTVPTAVGSYTVCATVVASANYNSAMATADFEIITQLVENATITLSQTSYTYDGEAHMPEVEKVTVGFTEIPADDYEVTYSNVVNAGTATVTVTFVEGYAGSVSTTFTIEKAQSIVKAKPTPIGGLVYNGKSQILVSGGRAEGGTMVYSLDNKNYNRLLPVKMVEGDYTVYYKVQGDANHYDTEPATVRATIGPSDSDYEKYNLWIGGVQVTEKNKVNVLNDPKEARFFFDEQSNQLVITNNQDEITIESRLPALTIILNEKVPSKLERIFGNNGTLTITTFPNIPGSLILKTDHYDGVICGFSEFNIANTYMMDPKNGKYAKYDGRPILLKQEGTDENDLPIYAIAQDATFGQTISPLVGGQMVTFSPEDYMTTDNNGNYVEVPLNNTAINDVLHTFNQAGSPEEEEDFFEMRERCLVLNTINNRENPARATRADDNGDDGQLIPGTEEYADAYRGYLTFMVPDGTGSAFVKTETEPGYQLKMKIMDDGSGSVSSKDFDDGMMRLDYDVAKPSYVQVWLEEDNSGNARHRIKPVGKRDRLHGRVYSIKVTPKKSSRNPLGEIDGFPEEMTPEVTLFDPSAINKVSVTHKVTYADGKWFTIDGRQIDKPSQKGVYIHNGEKIVVR